MPRKNVPILCSMVLMLLAAPATCATLTVAPISSNYTSIQPAIDDANPGDVIEVHSGTYKEHVFLNKRVELLGRDTGGGLPVIDANGTGSAITIYEDGVVLSGFNVTNSGHCGCGNAGIRIMSDNNTVYGNIAYKANYGIYSGPTKGNRIYHNDLVQNYISAFDEGTNQWWYVPYAAEVLLGRTRAIGNHYSDFDHPEMGCTDSTGDGVCDKAYKIRGGSNVDMYPLVLYRPLLDGEIGFNT